MRYFIQMDEIWLPIKDWPKYEVSNLGRVRRLDGMDGKNRYFVPGRILKPVPVQSGVSRDYMPLNVSLSDGPRCTYFKIAHLVLHAFRGPPPSKKENCCRHLDDDQENNKLNNLCWGTQKQNAADRIKNGLTGRLEKHKGSELTIELARQIRAQYKKSSRVANARILSQKYGVSEVDVYEIVKHLILKEEDVRS